MKLQSRRAIPQIPKLPHIVPQKTLKIRSEPIVKAGTDTGRTVKYLWNVPVLEFTQHDNGNVWARIGYNEWVAIFYDGTKLALIEDPPPTS